MVFLSGIALAEASGREFEMVWNPSPHCNCSFDALFENPLPARAGAAPDMTRWRDFRRYPPSKIPDLLADPTPHLRIVHFSWLINPGAYPAHRPLETRMQKLLNELEPLAPLGARIEAFRSASFRPRMIGVHLRRGDFTAARGDVVDNLKPACDAVDAFLERAPDAGILLCTDDGAPHPHSGHTPPAQGIRAVFSQRYGERVVSPVPRSLDRREPEAIQDALVELELLRATQWVVGTEGSTFSRLAAFGRDIPAVMTGGMSADYHRRLLRLKRNGVYYLVRALARLEYGPDVPYEFVARSYIQRAHTLLKTFSRGARK